MLFNNTNMRTAMAYTNAVGDKVYPIIVDIKKGIKSTEEILFVSSDINTGILSVAFIQGNDTYNVAGAEVVCSVMRPDASTLDIPCDIVRDNVVEVPLGINGTSQDGIYSFDFKVFKGGNKVVGTPIMNYSVSLSISNDNVVLEDDRLPVLTMLMTQVSELHDRTDEAVVKANTATEATKVATANAIEATNNANAVSERVSQETATTISEIKQDTENAIADVNATSDTMVENVNNAISSMNTTVNNKISEMTDTVNNKISEVNTAKTDMINDVSSTKANMVTEVTNAKNEMTATVTNKVNEVEGRFNALTASQQQSSEVIDARDGEVSLKARLDRDIEKAKQVYVNVEGNNISTDSSSGYAKDVEILGNTIQSASNLADIRSVGDTVEGQELYEIPVLSVGKNLFNIDTCVNGKILSGVNGEIEANASWFYTDFIKVKAGVTYRMGAYKQPFDPYYSCLYSKDKTFIKSNIGEVFTPSENGYVRLSGIIENKDKGQLEEGTVATPYEPYQEDKLTILSPVQLERVGDVADRIIEKDGVWGVEKWTTRKVLTASNVIHNGTVNDLTEYIIDTLENSNTTSGTNVVCNKLNTNFSTTSEGCFVTKNQFRVRVLTTKYPNAESMKNEIINNNWCVIYLTATPQFIPLPHSQQIKLRTFASKTNISFLTEIEGTIKAQVPKSLGATVNTHTEQIRSLNNELNRVKKLEESTVSTVTTESDFTNVEATSNGYFEDVKLEGKTLVNLFPKVAGVLHNSGAFLSFSAKNLNLINGKSYTILFTGIDNSKIKNYKISRIGVDAYLTGNTFTVNIAYDIDRGSDVFLYPISGYTFTQTDVDNLKVLILEGDHTQNPPSYFEGLKSVGDGTDEIVVSSVNENLFDGNFTIQGDISTSSYINVKGIDKVTINLSTSYEILDVNKLRILNDWTETGIIQIPKNGYYLKFWKRTTDIEGLDIQVNRGEKIKPYTPHQSDKKRLLYYNNETQAWEKPILREWDSIEKHADGKYYYHKRSGEVVLNGSESWIMTRGSGVDTTIFECKLPNYKPTGGLLSDKFKSIKYTSEIHRNEIEGIYYNFDTTVNKIAISINNSKLSTQDVQGFKQWLQANNVTVVYQLAQEKVYECTNIDLITYANETNYVVNSGAIAPKTTLKVHNNISNVVSLLQKKVSLLEDKFIQGLKQVLAGDMYSLAELLYPEDFVEENPENEIMLLPFE